MRYLPGYRYPALWIFAIPPWGRDFLTLLFPRARATERGRQGQEGNDKPTFKLLELGELPVVLPLPLSPHKR